MPNIKSAKKRLAISRRQNIKNSAARSTVRTAVKKFENAVTAGENSQAQLAYKDMVRSLDKAVSKGLMHKNTVARKKSRLSKRLKDMIS